MERVKGIEPSYSAWKAAALPLSYTRALLEHDLYRKTGTHPASSAGQAFFRIMLAELTRPRPRLNRLASRRQIALFRHADSAGQALTACDFAGYIASPTNQRKEVIQCLVSSAVTSLGSPAEQMS